MSVEVVPFFHSASNTFSYLVVDPASSKAAVIDPALDYDPETDTLASTSAQALVERGFSLVATSGTAAWLRDNGKIAPGPRVHVVSSGESLALIAQRYQVSLSSLRSANALKNDTIKVGQTLSIPATALAGQP